MEGTDPAARRFWLLQAVRLSGIGLAALGALIVAGRIALPSALGMVLIVTGAFEVFLLPAIIARRWKSTGR